MSLLDLRLRVLPCYLLDLLLLSMNCVGLALLWGRCQPQGLRGATVFVRRTVVVVTLGAGEVEREHRVVVWFGVPR